VVALLNAQTQPGKTAARTLLIGEFRGSTPSAQLEHCLQQGPYGVIAVRADEITADTPKGRSNALENLLTDLVDQGLVDGDTEIIIDLHGIEEDGVLELTTCDDELAMPATHLLEALERSPQDATSSGCVTFLCCESKVLHEQVQDYPHSFLFLSGRHSIGAGDAEATMKEQIRFSACYDEPPTAEDLWQHAGLTTGENPTLSGHGRLETLRLLDKASIAIPEEQQWLHLRAKLRHGSTDTVAELLLRYGTEMIFDSTETVPLLHTLISSCEKSTADKVQLLILLGWDVNADHGQGMTPLHLACLHGDLELVKLLLENGADPTLTDKEGLTPRERAQRSLQTKEDQAKYLAIFDSFDKGQRFPRYSANYFAGMMCAEGNAAVIELLLQEQPDLLEGDGPGGNGLLTVAIATRQPAIAHLLLRSLPEQVSHENLIGEMPLHIACQRMDGEMIDALLEAGADANHGNYRGMTPLMFSADRGDIDTMAILIDAGADIHRQTRGGNSALHIAVANGDRDTARQLLAWGATPALKNQRGETAQDIAKRRGDTRMMALLASQQG
jgi:ankyrin repeat protein